MTRINVVPVTELTDNFLIAEYFELPRIWGLIQKAVIKDDRDIPSTYILGKGHLRFFYDKITWLDLRHKLLWREGMRRGLDLGKDPFVTVTYDDLIATTKTMKLLQSEKSIRFWFKDYIPTNEAIQLSRNRLQVRRRYEGGLYAAEPS